MILKHISGLNVKGRTFNHDLKPVTIIAGDNAKGKTAILCAIDMALAPKIAPASYPKYAPLFEGFPTMRADLTSDAGTFSRQFDRRGDSIKLTVDERPEVVIPPIALDASVYFDLSIDKRTTFVASMVKLPDSLSEQAVIAELKNKLVLPEGRNNETTQEIVNHIIDTINDSADVIHRADVPVQEWLAQQIVAAGKRQSSARDTKLRMEKSAQASVQIQLTDASIPTSSIPALEEQLAAVSAALRVEHENIGKVKADKDADVGARAQRKERRKFLQQKLYALVDQSETILTYNQQILANQTLASEYVSKTPDLTSQKQMLATKAAGMKLLKETEITNTVKGYEREQKSLNQAYADVAGEMAVLKEKIQNIESQTCCPMCKASGEGWRDGVKNEWQTQFNEKLEKHEELHNKIVEVSELLNIEQARLKAVPQMPELAEIVSQIATLDEAIKTSSTEDSLNRQIVVSTIPDLVKKRDEATKKQTERTSVQEQLVELGDPAEDEKPPARDYDSEINAATTRVNELNNQSGQLQEKLKLAAAAAQQAARKAQEEAERTKAVDDYELQTITVDVLKEFQSKMVETAFSTLLADANLIADAVMSSPLAYKDGDIGRYDSQQRWISHRCFSGTEQAATFAAMSFALATTSACRIVRLDELGRLDQSNKKRFIERMVQLVCDGKIDQFIGVDVSLTPYSQTEGVHVIELA